MENFPPTKNEQKRIFVALGKRLFHSMKCCFLFHVLLKFIMLLTSFPFLPQISNIFILFRVFLKENDMQDVLQDFEVIHKSNCITLHVFLQLKTDFCYFQEEKFYFKLMSGKSQKNLIYFKFSFCFKSNLLKLMSSSLIFSENF